MTLKEQTIFFFIIASAILLGAFINEARNRYEDHQTYIESNYLFGNPNIISAQSNIPLKRDNQIWVLKWFSVKEAQATQSAEPIPSPIEEYTNYVLKYISRYYPTTREQSKMIPVFICLLRNESGYWTNKGFGDGGRAGGIVQFHEPTYQAYRKIMINRGLVDEVGSRMNPEDAIHTMIWAFSDGRGTAWGPYLRGECK